MLPILWPGDPELDSWCIWTTRQYTGHQRSRHALSFFAMNQCYKYLQWLGYKMWMMGIPCEEPTYIQSDNKSVLSNNTIPYSKLRKKNQIILYHFFKGVLLETNSEWSMWILTKMRLVFLRKYCLLMRIAMLLYKACSIIYLEHPLLDVLGIK